MIREVNALEEELKERQGEFIKRERVYRMRLDELNRELEALRKTKTEWMDQDESLTQLRGVHGEIQKNVGLIQQHAAQLVHDQEQEMLASFRSRLVDVQAELDAERAKKYDGATAWIERARQLEVDVDGERDRADALDRTNQALGAEHGRLRQSFEMQEDDRAFLLRQLAGVRADNVKAREDIGRRQAQVAALDSGAPPQDLPPVRAPEQRDESSDAAYRDMIRKLNRLLDLERKHISQVKTAHDDWAALRTPLELSLQRAAAEVAHNVALRRGAADGGASAQANRRKLLQSRAQPAFDSAALERFSHGDRQQAIEIWLAMDGVLDSLYDQPQDDASKRKKAESKDADSASAPSR